MRKDLGIDQILNKPGNSSTNMANSSSTQPVTSVSGLRASAGQVGTNSSIPGSILAPRSTHVLTGARTPGEGCILRS